MPKYTFVCPKCSNSKTQLVSVTTETLPCDKCNELMPRQMPTLNGPSEVRETINSYTGTTWRKDQKEILAARQENYLWTVDIPRKVASGTYTVATMLEQGWIYIDDDGKVQTYTKPPHKR